MDSDYTDGPERRVKWFLFSACKEERHSSCSRSMGLNSGVYCACDCHTDEVVEAMEQRYYER